MFGIFQKISRKMKEKSFLRRKIFKIFACGEQKWFISKIFWFKTSPSSLKSPPQGANFFGRRNLLFREKQIKNTGTRYWGSPCRPWLIPRDCSLAHVGSTKVIFLIFADETDSMSENKGTGTENKMLVTCVFVASTIVFSVAYHNHVRNQTFRFRMMRSQSLVSHAVSFYPLRFPPRNRSATPLTLGFSTESRNNRFGNNSEEQCFLLSQKIQKKRPQQNFASFGGDFS